MVLDHSAFDSAAAVVSFTVVWGTATGGRAENERSLNFTISLGKKRQSTHDDGESNKTR